MVDNMEWFNVFGLIFIAVIMIPNVVFAIKCKDGFDNKWNNKYVEVTEQVGRLVNLFRMVKYHPEALQAELSFMLNSREEFFRQRGMQPETMTELQRAARMFYLIKASYGSKVSTFGVGFKDVSAIKNLQAVHERLIKVLIENKSFDEILQIHDSERTLFFIDPPYHGTEKFYQMKDDFGETEHRKLAEMLYNLKGKWILTYNDDAFVRNLYEGFHIEEVERVNNLGVAIGGEKVFKELIIRNY